MLVRDCMTKHPLMIEPTMPVLEAQGYMGEHDVRHLPVTADGKRLLGLVTRQTLLIQPARLSSLNVWEITRYLSNLRAGDVMVKNVITIHPDATVEEAARLMTRKRIGCLPVLDEGIVVGIITELDLMAQMLQLLGAQFVGLRVTVEIPDRLGEFAKLTRAIAERGWGFIGVATYPAPRAQDRWQVVFKVRNVERGALLAALEQIEDQRVLDVREL
ncbi:MAG: CBS and ACT domain-containing protein [Ardenticatenaceae bacterium]|nr:CBS and ACT domain-containing protein [Ardenticatenaceae bacterium]HBY93384.1 acetoin dehydrogenase [Chloroflexota bacterium]